MSESFVFSTPFFGFPEDFSSVAAAAREEYAKKGAFFLEKDYLLEVHRRYGAFPRTLEEVLAAADALKKDCSMVRLYFTRLIIAIIRQ